MRHAHLSVEGLDSRLNPTHTWGYTGFGNGVWETAANWSPASVPSSGEDVHIPGGTSGIAATGNKTVGALNIDADWDQALNSNGDFTVQGTSLLESGTICVGDQKTFYIDSDDFSTSDVTFDVIPYSGYVGLGETPPVVLGKVTVNTGKKWVFVTQDTESGNEIVNNGDMTWNAEGRVLHITKPTATITNNSHLYFRGPNTQIMYDGTGQAPTLTNATTAVIYKESISPAATGGTSTIHLPVQNNGVVEVTKGNLKFNGAFATTGESVKSSGNVSLYGAQTHNKITNTNLWLQDGGTIYIFAESALRSFGADWAGDLKLKGGSTLRMDSSFGSAAFDYVTLAQAGNVTFEDATYRCNGRFDNDTNKTPRGNLWTVDGNITIGAAATLKWELNAGDRNGRTGNLFKVLEAIGTGHSITNNFVNLDLTTGYTETKSGNEIWIKW